jgi:RNA polymerase sigma-70 factor (ECF subfamily)
MDINEFKTIYYEQYKLLSLISLRIVKDRDTANDVVQDVFLNLLEKIETTKIEKDISSYLKRAVYYKSLDFLKSKSTRNDILNNLNFDTETESLEQIIELSELEERIYKSIDELPEQCRQIFKMSRFEGVNNKTIAEKLGISTRTVETHISKAIKKLKETLKVVRIFFSLFY